jgi:gamma-glutamyl:cysteine ligase YbdK (ATP-grasp superfamily)
MKSAKSIFCGTMSLCTSRHLLPRAAKANLASKISPRQHHHHRTFTSTASHFTRIRQVKEVTATVRPRQGWSTLQLLGLAAATGLLGTVVAVQQARALQLKERNYAHPEKFKKPQYASIHDLEAVSRLFSCENSSC